MDIQCSLLSTVKQEMTGYQFVGCKFKMTNKYNERNTGLLKILLEEKDDYVAVKIILCR